jgi:hypothetical protein
MWVNLTFEVLHFLNCFEITFTTLFFNRYAATFVPKRFTKRTKDVPFAKEKFRKSQETL